MKSYKEYKITVDDLELRVTSLESGNTPPPGLSGLLIFLLFFCGITLGCFFSLISEHGTDITLDFLAYSLPIAAGIIGGLVIYYPSLGRRYFALSAGFLSAGMACYFAMKGLNGWVVTAGPIVSALLIFGVIYEETRHPAPVKWRRWVLVGFLGMSLLLMIGISVVFVLGALNSHVQKKCSIILNTPAKAKITQTPEKTASPNLKVPAVSEETFELVRGAVIEIFPCSK